MHLILPILSALLLALAYLLPFHKLPWTTFGSEILAFLSGITLLCIFLKKNLKIPKPQLLALPILLIPFIQYGFGQILYFSNALLCSVYLLMFWLMVIVGYNLSLDKVKREKAFTSISIVILIVALLSSVMAILQWLGLNSYFAPFMNFLKGNRPYANFAQPNNLATFLTMGVFACLYFYEKRLIANVVIVPATLILIFSIALTQSRTSWVVCLFVLIYLAIKQFNQFKRFSFAKLLLWVGVFVAAIGLLPYFNSFINTFSQQDVVTTASVIQRASSGYLRLDMWSQAWVAIQQQPWWGYGWNQTGIAQIAAFDLYPSHEWYKTAHNVILDLLVWNGIPLGILIILYVVGWLYWLNKGIKEPVSLVATLMVCAILIHALLEYPIHYAYFLLPMGFLLGIIQAQYPHLPSKNLKPAVTLSLVLIGISLCVIVYRDYQLYRQQSVYVNTKKPLTDAQQQVMNQQIWLLSQFKERVWWISLDPFTKMSDVQLQHLGRMVANLASKYDLFKYAQILAFNGKKAEAEHQLWILSELHREKHSYQDVLPKTEK
ncbi:O-antigen ligase family protein [Acinetobacter defluvii]|uniref:O-antigen ligase family protein n=1 Tax=Acinetobacter defluvii TaxID=1871111 RepID=A0A2S2FGU4_9GAMM|nr:O-antigen ligase family protein [Acinetobacter defluvii]AWL30201.1 O-antigen ligase family protein [Acinetobacter defluvii]